MQNAGVLVSKTDLDHKGSIIGVFGTSETDINSIGFIIDLLGDTGYEIIDVRYAIDRAKILKLAPETLDTATYNNDSDAISTEKYSYKKTLAVSSTWTGTQTYKAGIKVILKGKVPFIGDTGVELIAEGSWAYTTGGALTTTVEKLWDSTIPVPTRSRIEVRAKITSATLEIPYTAKLRKTRWDGTNVEDPAFSGVYQGVAYTEAIVDKHQTPLYPIDRIVGWYKLEHAKNPWHYVTITKVNEATLEWKNDAAVAWTLKTTNNPNELAVDCPTYPADKTAAVVRRGDTVIRLRWRNETYIRDLLGSIVGEWAYEQADPTNDWHFATITRVAGDDATLQ